jgi:FkbM family methyltransferase
MTENSVTRLMRSWFPRHFGASKVKSALGAETGSAQAELLAEMRQRLIHIEAKADHLIERLTGVTARRVIQEGHSDQPFGNRTYAQFGEDLIIVNIFDMLGISKPSYIDIGAHHPLNISNTALLYMRGSRGINVEANSSLIGEFEKYRPEDINLNVGVGPAAGALEFYFIDEWSGRNTFSKAAAEDFVRENPEFRIQKIERCPVVTLDAVVAQHASSRFPDLLTLDAEGLDFEILQATTFNSDRPIVICVEALSGGDNDNSGCLAELLRDRGYVPFGRTVGNLIFVHHSAAEALDVARTSIPPSA